TERPEYERPSGSRPGGVRRAVSGTGRDRGANSVDEPPLCSPDAAAPVQPQRDSRTNTRWGYAALGVRLGLETELPVGGYENVGHDSRTAAASGHRSCSPSCL